MQENSGLCNFHELQMKFKALLKSKFYSNFAVTLALTLHVSSYSPFFTQLGTTDQGVLTY